MCWTLSAKKIYKWNSNRRFCYIWWKSGQNFVTIELTFTYINKKKVYIKILKTPKIVFYGPGMVNILPEVIPISHFSKGNSLTVSLLNFTIKLQRHKKIVVLQVKLLPLSWQAHLPVPPLIANVPEGHQTRGSPNFKTSLSRHSQNILNLIPEEFVLLWLPGYSK